MGHDDAAEFDGVDLPPEAFNRPGMSAFLQAYRAAPAGAVIEVRAASPANDPNVTLLVVSVDHADIERTTMAITLTQAIGLADIADEAIAMFPDDPEAASVMHVMRELRRAVRALVH